MPRTPKSRTLRGPTAYYDLIPAFNAALATSGITQIECGTTGAAIKLVQRMNQYRILDRRLNHEKRLRMDLPEGYMAGIEMQNREDMLYLQSAYDVFIIRRNNTRVILERKPTHPWLSIMDANGNPINVVPIEVIDPYRIAQDKEYDRTHEEVEREIERGNKRSIVPGGTTQAPREKHDKPGVPLNLLGDEE